MYSCSMSITLWLFPGCLPSSNLHPHSFRQQFYSLVTSGSSASCPLSIMQPKLFDSERFDHFLLSDQRGLPLCPGGGSHTFPSTWHYPPPCPNLPHGLTQHTMLSEREQNLTLAVSSDPEAYIAEQPWASYFTGRSFSFLLCKKGHSRTEELQTLSSNNLGTLIAKTECNPQECNQLVMTKRLAGFWGFLWMPEFACAFGKMFCS